LDLSLLVLRSKNAWPYTSTPQYVFVAWCLVKHKEEVAGGWIMLNNGTLERERE
jgi:hypothetical protein